MNSAKESAAKTSEEMISDLYFQLENKGHVQKSDVFLLATDFLFRSNLVIIEIRRRNL